MNTTSTSRQRRRAAVASTVGTALEWYDYFLYGTAAATVFGRLFFPEADPLVATLLALMLEAPAEYAACLSEVIARVAA